MRTIHPRPAVAVALAGLLLLSACGGGGSMSGSSSAMAPPPPTEGQLITNPPMKLASYSTSDLLSMLGVDSVGKQLISLAYNPVCSIDVYQIQYQTVGGKGEATTASGALMVPTSGGSNCQGVRPIVLYAHGTNPDKAFNIAQITPNQNGEGLILAAVFAAQGYIVVAPNYAGYDTSTLGYHPYLVANQQAHDMMDALSAAKSALPVASSTSVTANGKVFVTGYSQGGFVAMATARAMQAANTPPTAAGPMSGPYALSAFADAIFMGEVTQSSPLNITFLVDAYQQTYGNVYTAPTDVFSSTYANGIGTLLPTSSGASNLYTQGLLPQHALFNSTPPSAAYAAMTPATMPTNLAPVFAQGFGSSFLVTNEYRLNYLTDQAAQPDAGFPNYTTGMPPSSPMNGLRQDLKTNDLRNWTPTAPMFLCGGDADPEVLFLNTQLIQKYWMGVAPAAPVTVLDIDSSGGPDPDLQAAFAAAKAAVAASAIAGGSSGTQAVFDNYHSGLVPPFCLSAVKRFFDTM
ncbi:MAG TPA: lipase family protein [Steroidobacteraceae bacterium]|nr:lipase family protein [Steroidobacteraceae bacterium]